MQLKAEGWPPEEAQSMGKRYTTTAPCATSSRQLTSHHQHAGSEGDEQVENKGVCTRMYVCIYAQ